MIKSLNYILSALALVLVPAVTLAADAPAAAPAKTETAMRAAGFLIGWYARGIPIADRQLAREWRNFKKAAPFWS